MLNLITFHFFRNFHERLTHEIMKNIIIQENIKWMIDAGGWLGDTCTQLAEKNTKIKIYTIEPSLENCIFIRKYIKKHNIKNIKVIQKCLSANNNLSFSTKSHSIFADKQYYKSDDGIGSITIDSIYKNHSDLGIIHLDVECYEFECLQGAHNAIKNGTVIFIVEILEINKNKQKIINLFRKHNYEIYIIPERVSYSWIGKNGSNFIFFPKTYNKINIKDFVIKYGLKKFRKF
jgi:FkbM family methyltransferase